MNNSWVYAGKQNGWVNVDDTEFVDIEEGPFGDIMHFTFNEESFESPVRFGSRPG